MPQISSSCSHEKHCNRIATRQTDPMRTRRLERHTKPKERPHREAETGIVPPLKVPPKTSQLTLSKTRVSSFNTLRTTAPSQNQRSSQNLALSPKHELGAPTPSTTIPPSTPSSFQETHSWHSFRNLIYNA